MMETATHPHTGKLESSLDFFSQIAPRLTWGQELIYGRV